MQLVFSAQEIGAAVKRIAEEIDRDYSGEEVHLLGVLKGSFLFLADLVRHLRVPCTVDFMQVSSYGENTVSSGVVRSRMRRRDPVRGRHVLVVEDIVDSGLTVEVVLAELRRQKPASLAVCALVDKAGRRERSVPVRYRGIAVDHGFLVGYGLDLHERFRNLPSIYRLEGEATSTAGKEKTMAVWTCPTCNYEKDSRCKPKKCPECDKPVEFQKKDEAPVAAKKAADPAKACKTCKPTAATKTAKKAAPAKAKK